MKIKKKLAEIKAEVAALLGRLPEGWLAKEIETAKRDPKRDVQTLEMICAALERAGKKRRKPSRRAKR